VPILYLECKLRESNEEIQRVHHSIQKLKKLVDDKNLGERSDLTKQLNNSQDRLYDSEKKNSVSTGSILSVYFLF